MSQTYYQRLDLGLVGYGLWLVFHRKIDRSQWGLRQCPLWFQVPCLYTPGWLVVPGPLLALLAGVSLLLVWWGCRWNGRSLYRSRRYRRSCWLFFWFFD